MYTKGEWQMLHTIDGKFNIFTDKGLIGRVWDNIEGAEANAHLIAAAPRMYEALSKFRDAMLSDSVKLYSKGLPSQVEMEKLIEQMKQAIAKAEGREE